MEFLKKLKKFDLIIIGIVIIAVIVGFLTLSQKRETSSNQIEAKTKVQIEIFLRGVTISSSNNIFEKGEKTFITIRNVPYTDLQITNVIFDRKKAIVPTLDSKKPFAIVDDVSAPYQYDFLITVEDDAKITKDYDGAVVGGTKIKIGLPITLEGKDYKLNGTVSNVSLVSQIEPEETITEQKEDEE